MMNAHYMRDALKVRFNNVKMVFNKTVNNGCSKRRPDVRIECLTHTIIVECDENQHKNTSCEDMRMMELFQDLGNRPLVVLRFNPDKYTDGDGCFKFTKTGNLSVNRKEWGVRIKCLSDRIEYYMKNIPNKEIIVERFYYNNI